VKLLTVHVREERDVVDARSRAKQIAALLKLDPQDQTRVATVVSELTRNALTYAGGGKAEFGLDTRAGARVLTVNVSDTGPGIPDLELVLSGAYRSTTGMGVGLFGSRRLMDDFEVHSEPGRGTTVRVAKHLPATLTVAEITRAADALARTQPRDPLTELQVQNQELMDTLAVLAEREERLRTLNQELEDTNRGVVALYAELEEKAESLREANQLKTRFLSYMSHEFRTPLNSILGLSRFLIARLDGELTPEQQKQVELIQGSAGDLLGMVNDLLDLAKVEAGKTDVQVTTFEVAQLFGALRALFQPLAVNPDVRLIFDEPHVVPPLMTDEGKVSQVLRNFISNALKFTTAGEVRVTATHDPGGDVVRFAVRDTGIGIREEEQCKLFEDFTQVGPTRHGSTGTGLGLSIARRFTELLGGTVGLQSTPDVGSVFYADVPRVYPAPETPDAHAQPPARDDARTDAPHDAATTILIVDDSEADRYLLRTLLTRAGFDVREATDGVAGLREARARPYHAVLLDLSMPGMNGLAVLRALRSEPTTHDVPVMVVTSQVLDGHLHEELRALRAAPYAKERLYQGDTLDLLASLDALVEASRRNV